MFVKFNQRFDKQFHKAPVKIQKAFGKRLDIFILDQFHSLLNNHALKGKYQGGRSINITGDWRAVYQTINQGSTAYFIALGTHGQLYK